MNKKHIENLIKYSGFVPCPHILIRFVCSFVCRFVCLAWFVSLDKTMPYSRLASIRDELDSSSQVLRLQISTTIPCLHFEFLYPNLHISIYFI
jgi:hypothetical protein